MNIRDSQICDLIRQDISKNILGIGLNSHMKIIDKYNKFNEILLKASIDDIKYENNPYQVHEVLMDNDIDLMIKNKYLISKKNNKNQKIQKIFKNITNKKFDIVVNDYKKIDICKFAAPYMNIDKIFDVDTKNQLINLINDQLKTNQLFTFDADFVIVNKKNKYICSKGELELIKFLVLYYTKNNSVIFIDEPCKHLSSQNKERFRKIFLESESINKQIIAITHDVELISEKTCDNIIRFGMNEKNKTTVYNLSGLIKNKKDDNKKKLLVRSRGVLFSELCLLVEGDSDKIFIEIFLEYCERINSKYPKYFVIDLRGCGTKIWEILDELDIKYKCIYDYDTIAIKSNKKIKYKAIDFKKISEFPHIDKIIPHEKKINKIYNILKNKYNYKCLSDQKNIISDIFSEDDCTFAYVKNRIAIYETNNKKNLKDKKFLEQHIENINMCMNLIYTDIGINIEDINEILKKYDFFVWDYSIYDIEGIWNELKGISSDKKGVGTYEEISDVLDNFIDINNKKFTNVSLQKLCDFLLEESNNPIKIHTI